MPRPMSGGGCPVAFLLFCELTAHGHVEAAALCGTRQRPVVLKKKIHRSGLRLEIIEFLTFRITEGLIVVFRVEYCRILGRDT